MINFNSLKFLLSSVPLLLFLFLFTATQPTQASTKNDQNQIQFKTTNTNTKNNQNYNAVDLNYMQMIMAHHREAIAMANVEIERGRKSSIKEFARDMRNEQMGSLEKAEQLYRKTFKTQPPKNMTSNLLNQLKGSTNVDKDFLRLMYKHHLQGANMDWTELRSGKNENIKEFARKDMAMQFKDIRTIIHLFTHLKKVR